MTNIGPQYPNNKLDWDMEDLYKAEDLIKAGMTGYDINTLANRLYKERTADDKTPS